MNIIYYLIFFAFFLFIKKSIKKNAKCCLYAYYEKNELYKNNFKFFLKNLKLFLKNGILKDVDYFFIINGSCSLNINKIISKKNIYNKLTNINIIYRDNKGYDFGAYNYVINNYNLNYDYYFFMNSSVIGPYLNAWK